MNSFQYQIIFLGVFLVVVIFFSLSSVEPVPYSDNSVFSKAYPYSEGFEKAIKEAVIMQEKPATSEQKIPRDYNPFVTIENFTSLKSVTDLPSSPYGDEKPIDEISRLSSGPQCEPSAFSKSSGYVCLDPHAKKMLSTRGGNQTGSPSQIGR